VSSCNLIDPDLYLQLFLDRNTFEDILGLLLTLFHKIDRDHHLDAAAGVNHEKPPEEFFLLETSKSLQILPILKYMSNSYMSNSFSF
jgi:hypothetical protein